MKPKASILAVLIFLTLMIARGDCDENGYDPLLGASVSESSSLEKFVLSRSIPGYATEVYLQSGEEPGPVTIILSGAHGDEPAGVAALREYLKDYRIRHGTLVILPLQNPVAAGRGTRCSLGSGFNNYSNFARAYPCPTPTKLRDKLIVDSLSGLGSVWWYTGDWEFTSKKGPIFPGDWDALTAEEVLDGKGYRRALAPSIRMAGENVFKLFNGEFPDGSRRYEQVSYVVDCHESLNNYQDSFCADSDLSEDYVKGFLNDYNREMKEKGFKPFTFILDPIPTSLLWSSSFELAVPAISITVETDGTATYEARVQRQLMTVLYLLERFGNEPYKVAERD